MKKSVFRWCLLSITAWALLGCSRSIVSQRIDPEEIPDREYNVTVHKGLYSKYYAVLFDIPHDGTRVFMLHTEFTRTIGRDRPDKYLERFQERIRYYRALKILGKDGALRGYLVISNLLSHKTYRNPDRDSIMIQVLDPALRARGSE